jgi:lipoic acid synthetase
VVITSVDRDDLRDGGAGSTSSTASARRATSRRDTDRGAGARLPRPHDRALDILKAAPPDVMNHNLETVPRLYKEARPGSRLRIQLNLLKKFKARCPACRPRAA